MGSLPTLFHFIGGIPPDEVSWKLYGAALGQRGNEVVVIWRERRWSGEELGGVAPLPFEATKPIWKVPAWDVVPARVPVPSACGVKVMPAGRLPNSETVGVGVPAAVTVKVPAALWANVVASAEVMAGAWSTVRVKDWAGRAAPPLEAVKVIGNDPVSVGVPDSEPWVKDTPPGRVPDSVIGGRRVTGGRWREAPPGADEEGRRRRRGDGRRLVHGEGEGLGGRAAHAVGGPDGDRVAPTVPAAGVPDSVPVPSPLSTKETPFGSAPLSDSDAVGVPVETSVNEPALDVVKVVLLAEVMAGAASTVRVKDWVAVRAHPVGGGDGDRVAPAARRAGVPEIVAVPSPLSTKVTPLRQAAALGQ